MLSTTLVYPIDRRSAVQWWTICRVVSVVQALFLSFLIVPCSLTIPSATGKQPDTSKITPVRSLNPSNIEQTVLTVMYTI
jgi:hypothetical protein